MKIPTFQTPYYNSNNLYQNHYAQKCQKQPNLLKEMRPNLVQHQTERAAQIIDRRVSLERVEERQKSMYPVFNGMENLQKEEDNLRKLIKGIQLHIVELKQNDVKGQLEDLYGALGNMKVYADVIRKYEKWAEEESYPEEERQFYRDALLSLKIGMDDEFTRQSDQIKGLARSEVTTEQLRDILFEGESFQNMNGDKIWQYLDRAQRALKECGYETKKDSLGNICMGKMEFEYKKTFEVRGFQKYGRVHILGVEDIILTPEHLKTEFLVIDGLNKEEIVTLPPPVIDVENY